jgi:hypothetical protein
MTHWTKCLLQVASLTTLLTTGCGPAYHSYSGCYVNCRYCPPAPLPWSYFEGCPCHGNAASMYLARASEQVAKLPDSDGRAKLGW